MKFQYFLFSALLLFVVACHKVDNRLDYLNELPSIAGYKNNYAIGDTMSITGRLFPASGNLAIHVGGVSAVITNTQTTIIVNSYTRKPEKVDVVSFVITSAMGTGKQRPVQIMSNGNTIFGPPVNIYAFALPSRQTDTTLYVDQLATWAPSNLASYKLGSTVLPVLTSANVTGDGRIFFSNPTGVFSLSGDKVKEELRKGKTFTENGAAFSINWVLGSAVAVDGNSLFFSAETTEAGTTPGQYYIYRLCKIDINTGVVQTLNKTLVPQVPPTNGFSDQSPYEGSGSSVKIIATNIKTNIAGDLFFINDYPSSTVRSPVHLSFWHTWLVSGMNHPTAAFRGLVAGNICRLQQGGQLRSFIKDATANNGLQVPGYPAMFTTDYLLSPDANALYAVNLVNKSGFGSYFTLFRFNLQTEDPEIVTDDGNAEYLFYSSDTAAGTTIQPSNFKFRGINCHFLTYLGNSSISRIHALPLPGGNLLMSSSYLAGNSVLSFNPEERTCYAYAGTERGINKMNPDQRMEMGLARWVSFSSFGFMKAFCGIDRSGAVYFMGGTGNSASATKATVTFYKLYSKK